MERSFVVSYLKQIFRSFVFKAILDPLCGMYSIAILFFRLQHMFLGMVLVHGTKTNERDEERACLSCDTLPVSTSLRSSVAIARTFELFPSIHIFDPKIGYPF